MTTDNPADRRQPPHPPVGRFIAAGLALTLAGFGGFGTWAALVPLASAAVAPGTVTADSNRKTVQHLDGGIVAEILVRDGDRVVAGQPLIRLDDLESRSTVTVLEGQLWALLAQEARLIAERDEVATMTLPKALAAKAAAPASAGSVAEIVGGQQRIFLSRRASLDGRAVITRQRIAQLEAQIAGLEAQRRAGGRQLVLIQEEAAAVAEMVAKGLERKPRLLALMRQTAELDGMQGDLANRIAQAREAIAEADLEILGLRADRQSEVATELRDVQVRRAEAEEKLAAASIRQGRRDVLAPEAGTVMNLRTFAPGAVVAPGEAILDLVPLDDRLVIDARVSPNDIDVVHAGLPAKVVLSAFKSRTTPQLDGAVLRVSADAVIDDRTGQPYYQARVAVDATQLAALKDVHLLPGMPAETLIVTGERTLLRYLTQPIDDSFRKAFREE
ncbi:HlyD family type I secretion periplasmic adaptor subunit [Azospirillum sp. YIM B02556]|uniref:Membrane fusion protein (MFP) family protein n=1 Tax=Azospirillum endophyticum TaxID=2800326 RepID=A0ABS1FHZ7_9PROT|nr:HlyD family type I secretion periplasmic adaptor subunit [Azospirillum endophyticum]MBK1842958.1 HlyD family type I secretion periplasmic adaptor subunit [Azospirillum endophyticum]